MTGNGDAGSPNGPAASLPGTPQRLRRGAEIDDRIRSLEAKWKIGLKLRGAGWSPRKSSADDLADKIYGIVKRLYFSAQPALDDAVRHFKELAPRTAQEERLGLFYRMLLSKTNKDGPVSRTGTPRNEPPKNLASAQPGKHTLPHDYARNGSSIGQELPSFASAPYHSRLVIRHYSTFAPTVSYR
jgi:hypothetical protein